MVSYRLLSKFRCENRVHKIRGLCTAHSDVVAVPRQDLLFTERTNSCHQPPDRLFRRTEKQRDVQSTPSSLGTQNVR